MPRRADAQVIGSTCAPPTLPSALADSGELNISRSNGTFAFFPPGETGRRVVVGCSDRRHTAVFGWLGIPLNVLPGWALTDPVKHPRYANRLALEVVRREDDLRALLDP